MSMTADEVRRRRGTAARTLDIGVHDAGQLGCPHAPSEASGASFRAIPGVYSSRDGIHHDTTYGALLCPLCAALFDQTGGRR